MSQHSHQIPWESACLPSRREAIRVSARCDVLVGRALGLLRQQDNPQTRELDVCLKYQPPDAPHPTVRYLETADWQHAEERLSQEQVDKDVNRRDIGKTVLEDLQEQIDAITTRRTRDERKELGAVFAAFMRELEQDYEGGADNPAFQSACEVLQEFCRPKGITATRGSGAGTTVDGHSDALVRFRDATEAIKVRDNGRGGC